MFHTVLCFLVLNAFATCNPHSSGNWGRHHHDYGRRHHHWGKCGHHQSLTMTSVTEFDEIADEMIRIDSRAQTLCNSQYNVKELYNREYYEIVVTLQDFTENDIAMKIKHRLLEIKVQKGDLRYSNVIVVPSMVNPQQAAWDFTDKELHITMPYMFGQQNEIQRACDNSINEEVITVPKVDPNTFKIDVRFNDANLLIV